MTNLQTGFGLDSSLQGSQHYDGGIVDVSGGDVTFTERSGVIIRANVGGDIVVDLVADPAGAYHNGAETLIDFRNGVNSPEAVINNWETEWAFNTARTNPEFKRTLTSGGVDHRADRFLAYKEELTGSNLAKVNKYVTTKSI